MQTTNILYVTSLAYLLMLNQSQGGHFWRGRPARPCLCVHNKCTPAHTPLRGWSNSEIMAGGEEMEGKIERREWKEKQRGGKSVKTMMSETGSTGT